MAENKETTEPIETTNFKFRIFSGKEESYNVVQPSVKVFNIIRKLALKSTEFGLHRKLEICKELALDWKKEIEIQNLEELEKLLDQISTKDPTHLSDKIFEARNIRERITDKSITPFDLKIKVVPHLFVDDNGNAPAVSKESEDDLLIGNIEKALGVFWDRINIDDDENFYDRISFQPFVDSEDEFPIADISIRTMKSIYQLQIQTSSISKKERQDICDEMKWSYEKVTPKKITDMKSKTQYWVEACSIVLRGVEITDSNKEHINVAEINRALAVFFAKSDGLL